MRANGNRRERGAYYTPEHLADFVARWAIRSSADAVLDPSAGLGSLVGAAARRATQLGAASAPDIWGVELHRRSFERLTRNCEEFGIPSDHLTKGDFFRVASDLGAFDVVLTNPPYVRHHEMPARAVDKMRRALMPMGESIDGKASSWAYFIVRSTQLLRDGGRIAAIVPGELVSADYGRKLLGYLSARFARIVLVRCEGEPFGDLQLAPIVILGDSYRTDADSDGAVYGCSLDFADNEPALPALERMARIANPQRATPTLFTGARSADLRLVEGATAHGPIRELRDVATVGIGYVSGDTRFFHCTEEERLAASLRTKDLKRAICRGSYLDGSVLRRRDWNAIRDTDKPCWLIHPRKSPAESVEPLLARGVEDGVADRTKCQARDPWWRVPLGGVPDAFLVYLGGRPRIVENRARVYAPNSLFVITAAERSAESLSAASMTSVFQLSALLAARRLGGGLRKLQVRDAGSLPIPHAVVTREGCDEIDSLVRDDSWDDAIDLADELILEQGLGWSNRKIANWRSRLRWLVTQGDE